MNKQRKKDVALKEYKAIEEPARKEYEAKCRKIDEE